MIVTCPKCRSRYHIDVKRLPNTGGQVPCVECSGSIALKPPPPAPSKALPNRIKPIQRAVKRPRRPAPKREERHLVSLSVRFNNARSYVEQYAENLSNGGIFVAGAHHLEVRDLVSIEITLPGFEAHTVEAEVAHILPEDIAERLGRHPGAGFAIQNPPPQFRRALTSYLLRLGGRCDAVVYTDDEALAATLDAAGFQIAPLLPPDTLTETMQASRTLVVGVVVQASLAPVYRQAFISAKLPDVIIEHGETGDADDLLNRLDVAVLALPLLH